MAKGSIWKPESDSALLLEIVMIGDMKSLKWPAVAAAMQQKGFGFTAEACRYVSLSPIATP